MKPSTPLPWECPGLDADEYVICASPKGKRRTIAHVYRHTDLGIKREDNAAYIVHACNAYPELVAALRNCWADCMNGSEDALGGSIEIIEALLAKLGEST